MFGVSHQAMGAAAVGRNNLAYDAASKLGLLSNLKLCLDARDAASYGGTGQSWTDRSGVSSTFNRGTGSGSDAADPTFNGTPGSLAAYWSFDGGDVFTYSTSNAAWMNNLHKDGAKFTAIVWGYFNSLPGSTGLFGTGRSASGARPGLYFGTTGANHLQVSCANDTTGIGPASSFTVTAGAWKMWSASLDENAGGNNYILGEDLSFEASSFSYVDPPSTSNAALTATIGARGSDLNSPVPASTRIATVALWEGVALTQDQIAAFFEATRGGFGI